MRNESKYIYLFKNIGLLALSNFATRFLSFFLVPLYTNILTTTEYGTYDLFTTTVGVLVPILTVNIQDAVIRFALEKDFDNKAVATIAVRYLLLGSAVVLLGLVVNGIFGFSDAGRDYTAFFFLMFLSQALSGIVTSFIRGIDRIKELSISSVIASAVTIGCNILFLVVFRWGLNGYFLANIIGPLIQSLYLLIYAHIPSYIKPKERYAQEKKEMLAYCKPLIANSIAWWVNNASDRYVVIFFCGIAANGIYSVASKIPSMLNIVQSIFTQAWTISAVVDYNERNKSGFFDNTYKAYNCLLVILCSAIIASDKILAYFLYSGDFYEAWRYVPWLTIAIVFGAMSGYIGGIFSAVKDSKTTASTTIGGAVCNTVLNVILTPFMGPLGAAIATAISYCAVWIFRFFYSRKLINLHIDLKRDVISYTLLVIQSVVLLMISDNFILYMIQFVIFITILVLYRRDLILFISKCKAKVLNQN